MSNRMQDPDERTQLLDVSKQKKPASRIQLALLVLYRAAHVWSASLLNVYRSNATIQPICFSFIFPFIAPLLVHLGIATDKSVGKPAGLVEAAYSISLLVGLAPAVIISDAFGRKKTILFGLLGASMASAYFGFAQSLGGLVLARALVGFSVAFIPATVVTMLVELSTKQTQALHFSLSGLGWSLGSLSAPMIGGFFSSFPDTAHLPQFLKEHPYAMPGLVVGALTIFTALAGIFLTQETLHKANRRPILAQLSADKGEEAQKTGSAPLLGMFTRSSSFMMGLWFLAVFQSFLAMSCEVLFFYSPRNLGGLALTSRESAMIWTLRSVLSIFWGVPIFPRLVNKFGCEALLRNFSLGLPFIHLSNLALAFATYSGLPHKWVIVWLWTASVIQLPIQSVFSATSQLLAMRAPSKAYLTRITTVSEYSSNLGHGLGALCGSFWFKFCVERGLVRGRAEWILHAVVAMIFSVLARRVTVEKGWRDLEEEEDEE